MNRVVPEVGAILKRERELANKIDELKGKVHNFIFWQRVRFLIGSAIGGLVGGVLGGIFFKWLNG